MELRLDGKVALVTGASKGIGLAIARTFAEAGARVMLSARKRERLEEAAAGIDGETAVFPANAGDLAAGVAAVEATVETFGGLDILVNNAATNPYYGPVLGIDVPRYDKTVEVNVRGPLFWTQAAYDRVMRDHPGVIINIASLGGMKPEPGIGVYNLTKATIIHLTAQLAAELGPTRVVCIAPGLVKTDFARVLVETWGKELEEKLPMGRLGEPQDIANMALFLASDAASWITGQTFVVDGGSSVQANHEH